MRFFHPELKYNEYQNDLENIDRIPDGKVIEMAISFDKPHSIHEMDVIQYQFKIVNVTWAWLDEFEQKKIDEFKDEIKNYDAKANGINEDDIVGINISGKYYMDYNEKYDELLDKLKKSHFIDHKNLYEEIMKRGKTSENDAKVLGIVVQGTKKELSELRGNPMIKATSIGIVTDELY